MNACITHTAWALSLGLALAACGASANPSEVDRKVAPELIPIAARQQFTCHQSLQEPSSGTYTKRYTLLDSVEIEIDCIRFGEMQYRITNEGAAEVHVRVKLVPESDDIDYGRAFDLSAFLLGAEAIADFRLPSSRFAPSNTAGGGVRWRDYSATEPGSTFEILVDTGSQRVIDQAESLPAFTYQASLMNHPARTRVYSTFRDFRLSSSGSDSSPCGGHVYAAASFYLCMRRGEPETGEAPILLLPMLSVTQSEAFEVLDRRFPEVFATSHLIDVGADYLKKWLAVFDPQSKLSCGELMAQWQMAGGDDVLNPRTLNAQLETDVVREELQLRLAHSDLDEEVGEFLNTQRDESVDGWERISEDEFQGLRISLSAAVRDFFQTTVE